jgi:glucose-1-phosphate adenylyltransferase
MGIYIFRSDILREVLLESESEDFGRQIIPQAIESRRVYGYLFNGYWEDIGTIHSFYDANMALTQADPPFDFYNPKHPIYTRPRFLPPSRADGCHLDNCVLAEGCIIERADVRDSVIGLRSIIGPDTHLTRTVMMGADFYEAPERKIENRRLEIPDIGIGRGSRIESAIIDKNARIGERVTIRSHEDDDQSIETDNYSIKDGIVVIPKNAIIPDGTVI